MTRWEVGINGDEGQLRMLADVFRGPKWTITPRGSEFLLSGPDLEVLADAGAVRVKALEVMASISGASSVVLGSMGRLTVGHVAGVHVNGKRDIYVFTEPVVVRVSVPPPSVTYGRADGSVEVFLPGDPVARAVDKADRSEAVRFVLRLRSAGELLWTDLYRILDAIEADGGPISASKNELTRFTRTANSKSAAGDLARHGREQTDPPSNPMTLREARGFIDKIIGAWLASK